MPILIPNEARCPKAVAHDFRDVASYPDATVEMCVNCSKRVIWKQDERGRMDNRGYLRAHFRSFVQPVGSNAQAFAAIHGEKAWRKAVEERPNELPMDWDLAGEDAKKYLRELKKEQKII